jgi:cell wall-associated NlpC family hydrolase
LTTGVQQLPELDPLDRRLNAWRSDLADMRLREKVASKRYVVGEGAAVVSAICDLRPRPEPQCPVDHQLLGGDVVLVFERAGQWAWVQARRDGYVGWIQARHLAGVVPEPTHLVCTPRTFVYPGPDLKLPAVRTLSMGTGLSPAGEEVVRGARYVILKSGEALFARHVRPIGKHDRDYVEVARRFIGTPYLWGGASGFGLDCSGLIYLAMRMCGRSVLRDSDMQAATVGQPIDPGSGLGNLRRGDLVFWRGHVAIVEGNGNLLHANGYTMDVTSEPLMQALDRIEQLFERPIGYRRP